MGDDVHSAQFLAFKDCLARKMLNIPNASLDDTESALAEFVAYLATEAWSSLPIVLRTATYEERELLFKSIPDLSSGQLESLNLNGISSGFTDTLVSYCIVPDDEDALKFLRKVLLDYIEQTTAPPPVWSSTRTTECEICERQVPLTYHHLIPRSTHEKVLKKGWHSVAMLNSVAWLCRPCHSAVHHVASNEDLARYYYTTSLLLEREDLQKWQRYAAKQWSRKY